MKATLILKQGMALWLLMLVLLAGCTCMPAPSELPPAKELGETQRIIEVKTDGLTCHYLCQSFWTEDEFSAHLANQAEFETNFKNDFEQREVKYNISVSDYQFSFDSATHSTIVRCNIHNAISLRAGNKYYAQFEWLLNPLGLDLIDNDFKESERGLSWEGSTNGVPTTVNVKLPTIDNSVYKAWEHPIGHCHAHAWWCE